MERPSGTGVGLSKSECLVCPFEEQCYRAIFFEEQTVKQENYLQMLKEYAFPMLRLSPGAIFQQDGAPPYWGLRARGRLDEEFTDRWIGRGGPTASPDVTPCNFFLLGFVKDRVFRTQVRKMEELKLRITNVVKTVSQNMLAICKHMEGTSSSADLAKRQ